MKYLTHDNFVLRIGEMSHGTEKSMGKGRTIRTIGLPLGLHGLTEAISRLHSYDTFRNCSKCGSAFTSKAAGGVRGLTHSEVCEIYRLS